MIVLISFNFNFRTPYADTVKTARWEYSTRPVYGWGDVMSKQKSTAGWLAAFPVFEPHWQVCMAGGLSTGKHDIFYLSNILVLLYLNFNEHFSSFLSFLVKLSQI